MVGAGEKLAWIFFAGMVVLDVLLLVAVILLSCGSDDDDDNDDYDEYEYYDSDWENKQELVETVDYT